MMNIKPVIRVLGVLTGFMIFSATSGCKEGEEMKNWIENTNKLQVKAKTQAEIVPYRAEQHQALKEYFIELANMALALKNDTKFAERFNSAASQSNLDEVCRKVLVSRDPEWMFMMKNCKKNSFFLCAEEVRSYPDIVASIRGKLNADLQKKFDQTEACRIAQDTEVDR